MGFGKTIAEWIRNYSVISRFARDDHASPESVDFSKNPHRVLLLNRQTNVYHGREDDARRGVHFLKVAWGITGSGDYISEVVNTMKEIAQRDSEVKIYIFLSKAAEKVVKWYALFKELRSISDKVYTEVDSNTTEPFYYIPGALQTGKFDFFIVCPATGNTVAKIVNGIADTLITNSVAQAAKANIPIYILPVDHIKGKQVTTLPSGEKLELEMREVDLDNTSKLSKMRNIHVFFNPAEIYEIFKKFSK